MNKLPKKTTWDHITDVLMWLLMAILLLPGSLVFIVWAIGKIIAWLIGG